MNECKEIREAIHTTFLLNLVSISCTQINHKNETMFKSINKILHYVPICLNNYASNLKTATLCSYMLKPLCRNLQTAPLHFWKLKIAPLCSCVLKLQLCRNLQIAPFYFNVFKKSCYKGSIVLIFEYCSKNLKITLITPKIYKIVRVFY